MRVLLTGASGTVGHHVIYKLLEKKYTVTILELDNKKNRKVLKPYENLTNIIWGSITDSSLINNIVLEQDIVIHLAGLIPPYADHHEELTRTINYGGTKNIVDAIKENNPKCFLMFASSISVYGDRVCNYNITINDELNISEGDYYALIKKQTEEMIIESNINYTIFRLSAIMDIPKTDPLMFHMPLETKLEITTAKDTASAFVNGISYIKELNHSIYNLGGGEQCRTTYREFLKDCFNIYGLNYKYIDEKLFADKNFHCGYYKDGYILDDIIHFRKDTLSSYYMYLKSNVSFVKKLVTKICSYIIIKSLNSKSETYIAMKSNDQKLLKRFFK